MELTNIVLKNFRTHRSASFDFTSGVTAIIGGNGSGKSSVVEAILFLFTGEGYGKTKAEMLTVGQTSGWVIGKLLIDGKEAVLERHIDTAKVNFMYDGKTYKKSGEVNEIWDKLFQIDKNIVHNVIVSNQGEIAMLFNGDSAAKEKLFQKIFMVPNTTKIRDIVWNNYIKDAPPEYPVKDTTQLTSDIQCLEQTITMSREELNALSYSSEEYNGYVTRKSYLAKVQESLSSHEKLLKDLESFESKSTEVKTRIAALEKKTKAIDIENYHKAVAELQANKKRQLARDEYLQKKKNLIIPDTEVDREKVQQQAKAILEIEAELKAKRAKVAELNSKIDEYEKSGLSSGVCPTCGTKVDNVVKLIEHIDNERAPIIREGIEQKAKLDKLKEKHELWLTLVKKWDAYSSELAAINSALEAYNDIEYDHETLELYLGVISKYREWNSELVSLLEKQRGLENQAHQTRTAIAGLTLYDKEPAGLSSEIEEINARLVALQKVQEERKRLEIEIAANTRELKGLEKDLSENKGYIDKNNKRKEYISVLKGVYDLFHTGKFPRALIQTYSSTVTEYMNEVLASFDFPYSAQVNETFGIDIFNEEGLELPSISGGQQVMVGFSLRLALHNMFVGAFPFMIVDEGSYGLNNENAKKYFEIIKTLGKSSKFKQVIVIDHHTELSEYVDNTISL